MIVVQSDATHMIKVEPVKTKRRIVKFLHAEFLEWNKSSYQKAKDFLGRAGECYVLSDNNKLTKFTVLLGGKIIGKTHVGTVIRFN